MNLITRLCIGLASLLLVLASLPAAAQQFERHAPGLRVLPPLVVVPPASTAIRLTHATLSAQVHGSLATTVMTLEFTNPNPRVLEGEMQFPLRPGQSVSAFALEMADGTMMPAVPVAKAKGREVFEDVIRRRADPALLEQTEGQQFRLRLYPLNPQQPRHVRIELSEALGYDGHERRVLRLPLDFGGTPAERLDISVDLGETGDGALELGSALSGAQVRRNAGSTLLSLSRSDYRAATVASTADAPLDAATLAWRAARGDSVATERNQAEAWFHAEVGVPAGARENKRPDHLDLIWDASGSGAARDHAREFQLLDRLFRWQPQVSVHLRVVRDAAEAERRFEVRQGDWTPLRRALERLPYDGASNAALWQPDRALPAARTLVLLFSDGLGNWGDDSPVASGGAPAHAVLASSTANPAWLRHWADAGGGGLIDLQALDSEHALQRITRSTARLLRVEGEGFDHWVAESRVAEDGRLRLAGRFTAHQADLQLVLAQPDGSERRQRLHIAAPTVSSAGEPGFAARRWASLRVADLLAEPRLHRSEIQTLGERFAILTPETSLIVLETLADFQRFGITPPAGPLRARYEEAVQVQDSARRRTRSDHLEDLVRRYAEYTAWWEQDFTRVGGRTQLFDRKEQGARTPTQDQLNGPAMADSEQRLTAPAAQRARAAAAAGAPAAAMMPAPAALSAAVAAQSPGQTAKALEAGTTPPGPTQEIGVTLAPWQPDSEAQRRLRDARSDERYAIYLDARTRAARSPAFYLDAAQVFEEQGQPELARRILSNLAEIDAGQRALLRVLAYRLQQYGDPGEALRVLRRVADLAPDEPQSWRDLGLALAAAGQPQAAVDTLWRVAAGSWDARFADIDLIALAELDAIAAVHPDVALTAVDSRLRRNLPLDVRAVLTWDSDNTDVDLWVQEPSGEWVSYQKPLSRQGGRISHDCIQGYGPEAYSLRVARPGRYEVRAHYYGSRQQTVSGYPTLMLHLTTGFGTAGERSRDIIVRLERIQDDVLVGSFEVGAGGQEHAR